jgi:hypothetical protein
MVSGGMKIRRWWCSFGLCSDTDRNIDQITRPVSNPVTCKRTPGPSNHGDHNGAPGHLTFPTLTLLPYRGKWTTTEHSFNLLSLCHIHLQIPFSRFFPGTKVMSVKGGQGRLCSTPFHYSVRIHHSSIFPSISTPPTR